MVNALINDFVLEEALIFLDTELENFIRTQNFPGSIKLASGKYLLANAALAERDGMRVKDYTGLTAYDVKEITSRRPEVTEQAVYMDKQIFSAQSPLVCYQQVIATCYQSIMIEEVIKKPIFGKDNQIVGLLAYGNDITRFKHPIQLFRLYESHYSEEEAIRYFLHYKKIDSLFEVPPTREELLTLLVMRDHLDIISISKILEYTSAEVKMHQKQLDEKLKVVNIHDCLMYLSIACENAAKDAIGWD